MIEAFLKLLLNPYQWQSLKKFYQFSQGINLFPLCSFTLCLSFIGKHIKDSLIHFIFTLGMYYNALPNTQQSLNSGFSIWGTYKTHQILQKGKFPDPRKLDSVYLSELDLVIQIFNKLLLSILCGRCYSLHFIDKETAMGTVAC